MQIREAFHIFQASALEGRRIIVAVDGWPRNSRYPNGHFVKNLGEVADKETFQRENKNSEEVWIFP